VSDAVLHIKPSHRNFLVFNILIWKKKSLPHFLQFQPVLDACILYRDLPDVTWPCQDTNLPGNLKGKTLLINCMQLRLLDFLTVTLKMPARHWEGRV